MLYDFPGQAKNNKFVSLWKDVEKSSHSEGQKKRNFPFFPDVFVLFILCFYPLTPHIV